MFTLVRVSGSHFSPIIMGDMTVSIQASAYHYCIPRVTLSSSDEYEAFEVALLWKDDWFHPEADARFSNCAWARYWSSSDDVAACVSRADIELMLEDLRKVFSESSVS